MRKAALIALAVLILPTLAYGQAKVGTAGAQFLEIGVSARAMSLGDAIIANIDDASALYYNPAAIAEFDRYKVMFTHIDYPTEINYEFAGITFPVSSLMGNVGISFYMLSTDDMLVTTYTNPTGLNAPTFQAKDYALGLSYASALTEHFSMGFTVKYIAELYHEYKADGWAADIGTYYNTGFRNLRISMLLKNFGPDMKFIDEKYSLPMDFKFGAAIDIFNMPSHHLIFSGQMAHPNDNLEKYATGLEYWFNDVVALRMGKLYNVDYVSTQEAFSTDGLTFGAGLKTELSDIGLIVDYGYQDFGFLNETHRFSIGLEF
ncbi:MAG: PorV/PorQ family protein [candidate division Zixibacteria bacterium]|nr:PorV/PorQ family protein [candidate division Zixibacteria bacterium]